MSILNTEKDGGICMEKKEQVINNISLNSPQNCTRLNKKGIKQIQP